MATRQELKEAYKQLKPVMGVFQLRNLLNGKVFIGSSINVEAMKNRTRVQLNFGNHPNAALMSDWKLMGEENFQFEILGEIKAKDTDVNVDYTREVKLLEEMYIDELKPFDDKGYHVVVG